MFEQYLKVLCTEHKKGGASNHKQIRSIIDIAKEGNQQAWDAITEAKRLADVEELDVNKLEYHPCTVHLSCLEEGSAFGGFEKYEKRFMQLAYTAPEVEVWYSQSLKKVCEQNALELAQYLPNFLWSGRLATALEENISGFDYPPTLVADWIFCSAFQYMFDFTGKRDFDFYGFPRAILGTNDWFEILNLFSGRKKWPSKFINNDGLGSWHPDEATIFEHYYDHFITSRWPYKEQKIRDLSSFYEEFSTIEYSPEIHDKNYLRTFTKGAWSKNLDNGKHYYDSLWHSRERLSVWMNILYAAVDRNQWMNKSESGQRLEWIRSIRLEYHNYPYDFSNIGKHLIAAAVVVAELLFEVCQHNGMLENEQVDKLLQSVHNYDLRINFGYKLVEMASIMNSDREKLENVESLKEYIANYRRERPKYSSLYDLDLSLGI